MAENKTSVVLILDADQRAALAATRSLGRKGIFVITADSKSKTLAGYSRYSREHWVYPSPYENPQAFFHVLLGWLSSRRIDVLFPITEVTSEILVRNRNELPQSVVLPFPEAASVSLLGSKVNLFKLAKKLSVPIPETWFIEDRDQAIRVIDNLSEWPKVFKPFRSRIEKGGKWISTSVRFAYSRLEAMELIERFTEFREFPFMIQSYIDGTGQGIFSLYQKGEAVAFFAHKRIREKPPSGGVSVLSESIPVDPIMKEIASHLLNAAEWHGVAMVEFKVTPEGSPYLMEINTRFWGSLQLAINAGVDFPYLLFQLAVGKLPPVDEIDYRVGIRSRWVLGDLDRLYLSLKGNSSFREKVAEVLSFFKFGRTTRHEVNQIDDLLPFIYELSCYFRAVFSKS